MSVLVIEQDGSAARYFKLTSDRVRIGRDPSCDVVLGSQFVSRMHADIVMTDEKVELMTGDQGDAPSAFYNGPIERLGIPELRMADAGAGIAPRGWEIEEAPEEHKKTYVGASLHLADEKSLGEAEAAPSPCTHSRRTRCLRRWSRHSQSVRRPRPRGRTPRPRTALR